MTRIAGTLGENATNPGLPENTTVAARAGGVVWEAAGYTDVGTVRSENQDRWAVATLADDSGVLLVVADGMGGHVGGAAAAQGAVDAALEVAAAGGQEPAVALTAAAHGAITEVAEQRRRRGGAVSGTTFLAAIVGRDGATFAHVGDCRAYSVRDGHTDQLTLDHTWVAEEVAAGRLDPARAAVDPRRNVLVRAITGDPVKIDIISTPLRPGDSLVLCSDGVWSVLDDAFIAAVAGEAGLDDGSIANAAQRLCNAALQEGSTDNVTAVVCRVAAKSS
jgi:PPM family protein phosphatase